MVERYRMSDAARQRLRDNVAAREAADAVDARDAFLGPRVYPKRSARRRTSPPPAAKPAPPSRPVYPSLFDGFFVTNINGRIVECNELGNPVPRRPRR